VEQLEAEPRALAHRRGRLCVVAHSARGLKTESHAERERERGRGGERESKGKGEREREGCCIRLCDKWFTIQLWCSALQYVAACCGVLQCAVLQWIAVWCGVLQ